MQQLLDCGGKLLSLSEPVVMGILNITPDSFSDGGRFLSQTAALKQAGAMLQEGAAIIDVGGESTRPGAPAVAIDEELSRVVPVIEAIRKEYDAIISIDTSKPEVMSRAVDAGAGIINDVRALRLPGAVQTAAKLKVPVCLMHMLGEPATMQSNPYYNNVTFEVIEFLKERIEACVSAGILRDKLLVDPGFGFGKDLSHNLQLLKELDQLAVLNAPRLIGVSRKSVIGQVLNVPPDRRLTGNVSAAVIAVMKGAKIIRVHDVGATVDAIKIVKAVNNAAI